MARSAPSHAIPNLRNMRDTYVNLLLSNGQQPIEPVQQTPRTSWTPGQNLGASYKEHAVHWASPVTPGLTENDMRVAEVAANLVAAGDAEKRNKDAIRALADKLEETERRNRELEATVRTAEKKRKEKRRVSYGEARRNIHFTPRTPRRSGGLDLGSERRRSRKPEREWLHEAPLHLELESFRMEQAQWHQEREKFRSMMSDIKRNTSRLLDEREELRRHRDASAKERDAHLQVIARLQNQLMEKKQREGLEAKRAFDPSSISKLAPMTPHSDDKVHFPSPTTSYQRGLSHAIFRRPNALSEENNECPVQADNLTITSNRDNTAVSSEEDMSGVQDEFGREEELQTELHLVNQENIRVSERNAALEAEIAQLKERIRLLEAEHVALHVKLKDREHSASIEADAGNLFAITSAQIANLLEEINILESVSVAIHFEISPSEADRAQQTLTDMGSFTSDRGTPMTKPRDEHLKGLTRREYEEVRTKSPADTINDAANRLAIIRTDLCSKYGTWLEAVANDVSSTGVETELESIDKENAILFHAASECMNTKVINQLIES